ncbi:MAG TPA: histidine kinase N-terminal 7TM domain-containing protein [Aggregatilineales bacterium]|nr:histidine kinase N-terminal 7TM domain-containing protein [Aggregatilineales bacterium]
MTPPYLPFIFTLFVTSVVAALLAMYAWHRRTVPGGVYFAILMALLAEWSFVIAAELATVDLPTKVTWAKLAYPAVVSLGPLWFLFALAYGHRSTWITRRRIILLWIVPAGILGLALTNEWHGLVWPRITPTSDTPGAILNYEHGIAVWVNVVYAYTLLLIGTIIIVRTALRSGPLFRQQSRLLVVGVAIPWIANALYVANITPLPGLDLTPFAFTLTGLTVAWTIFRFHMLDIVPIARDTLIENMSDAVVVLDARNRVVDMNPVVRRLFSQQDGNVIGQPAQTVFARWPDVVNRYLNSTEEQTEVVIDMPDGKRWLDMRISSLYDRNRQLNGRLIVIREITARKDAEAVLQQYNRELEAHNAELDAFAHTVAHDLKNPLNLVLGYSALLLDFRAGLSDEEVQQTLDGLTRTAKKMDRIIDELLLLAGVRKLSNIQMETVDMAHIVSEAQKRLMDMIADTQAVISSPTVWPTVTSYTPWIEEVWVNYISNALKYGGAPPHIELGYDIVPDPAAPPGSQDEQSHVRFWVRDHGSGLTPESQAQLFVEFTRLDQARARGQGLGLSIVRRIVEKLGGQVGVDSQIGQGSTFFFTLPLRREPV